MRPRVTVWAVPGSHLENVALTIGYALHLATAYRPRLVLGHWRHLADEVAIGFQGGRIARLEAALAAERAAREQLERELEAARRPRTRIQGVDMGGA